MCRSPFHARLLASILLALLFLVVTEGIQAATFTVTNTSDSGAGSLRQAIEDANNSPGADVITFDGGVNGTLVLSSTLPVITEDLEINGPGANILAISGNDAVRIFTIDNGVPVTVTGITLQNGLASGLSDAAKEGGAIRTEGPLTLVNMALRNNQAQREGGAVYMSSRFPYTRPTTLSVISTEVANNTANLEDSAFGDGGGFHVQGITVTVSMTDSVLTGNSGFDGGGLQVTYAGFSGAGSSAHVTLSNTSVFGNAGDRYGGGVSVFWMDTITVSVDAPIWGNSSGDFGGGLYVYGNSVNVQMTGADLYENDTSKDAEGRDGGGAYIAGGSLPGGPSGGATRVSLTNMDIYSNTAGSPGSPLFGSGGGLAISGITATLTLSNTNVYSNSANSNGGGLSFTHSGTGTVQFINGEVHNNRVDRRGGGLFITGSSGEGGSSVILTGTPLYANTAGPAGGGAYIFGSGSATFQTDSPIWGNRATGTGGGLYLNGAPGAVQMDGADLYDNRAETTSGAGGGAYVVGAFTASNGAIRDNSSGNSAGGVSATDLTLTSMQVFNNSAGSSAGGLSAGSFQRVASVVLSDTQVYSNSANAYGGLYISGPGGSLVDVANSRLHHNTSTTGSGGGVGINGVDQQGNDSLFFVSFQQTEIYANTASGSGGGLYIQGQNNTPIAFSMTDTSIYANTASGATGGGGLYYNTPNPASTSFWNNSTIRDNYSTGSGGGMELWGGHLSLQYTTLQDNRAMSFGGGANLRAGGQLTMIGGSVSGNTATSGGGGVYAGGSAWFTGTHVLFNEANFTGGLQQGSGATLQVTDGCIVGNSNNAVSANATVIATNNWWGAPNGPGGAGPGSGDSVTAGVDFSNFKSVAPVGCPSIAPVVSLSKTVQGNPAPGDPVTYTLMISNTGLADEPGVSLTDALPGEVDFAGWIEQPQGATANEDQISWSGSLAASEIVTFTFTATHLGGSQVVTNTATFSASLQLGQASAVYGAKPLLRVTKIGTGGGGVSSDPPGIACGDTCQAAYEPGTVVSLTATADTGSTFTGWGGNCAGAGLCVVTMDGAKQVSASFTQPIILTTYRAGSGRGKIISNPAAIDCGDDCTQSYPEGQSLALYALPETGNSFIGWEGACTDAGPCRLVMDASKAVTATFAPPGQITGTIVVTETQDARITVTAYRQINGNWWPQSSQTLFVPGSGIGAEYSIAVLPSGVYRVYFHDQNRFYQSEWFSGVEGLDQGLDVIVENNGTTPNIDATLRGPLPPAADVSTATGSITSDPDTGEITISYPRSKPSDITVRKALICSGSASPIDARLVTKRGFFPMTETPIGSGIYQATIPQSQLAAGEMKVTWQCGSTPVEEVIGHIVLYDPSGIISDAVSGDPVQGATVSLYRIPGWLPDTEEETRECRTIDTRIEGSEGTWNSEPPADAALGAFVNPVLDAALTDPDINPQVTDSIGYYGWDVAEGCWFVIVTAEAYEPKVSPLVGVPPEVTDLDLELTPYPVLTVTLAGQGSGRVRSTPGGVNCPGDCLQGFEPGTVVTLTASAGLNSVFAGWGGACTGTGVCTVTVQEARQVTATFDAHREIYLPIIIRYIDTF